MTNTIIWLHGSNPRPPVGPANPRVVTLLEQLMIRARRGEVPSLAIAMVVGRDDHVRAALTWIDVPEQHLALAGAMSKLACNITEARPCPSLVPEFEDDGIKDFVV